MANIVEEMFISIGFKQDKILADLDKLQKNLDKTKKSGVDANKEIASSAEGVLKAYRSIRNELILLAGTLTGISSLKSFFSDSVLGMQSLGYAAKYLGMTTERLQAMQLVAEKLGSSKESITNFLGALTLNLSELHSQGTGLFTQGGLLSFLGVGGQHGNLKNTESALLELSRLYNNVYAKSPEQAAQFASNMGIPTDLLPFLSKGKQGILDLLEAQKKYTVTSKEDAKKAEDFNKQLGDMRNNFEAGGKKIVEALLPALRDIIKEFDKLGDWFNNNSNKVAKTIESWANNARDFIKTLFSDDNKITNTLSKWSDNFAKIASGIEKIGKVAGIINDTYNFFNPDEYEPNKPGRIRKESKGSLIREALGQGVPDNAPMMAKAKEAVDFFVSKGWTREQAAGIAANIWRESSFNHRAVNPDGGAWGYAQWRGSRAKDFERVMGKPIMKASKLEQLQFIDWELRNTEKKAGGALKGSSTSLDAGRQVSLLYERHGNIAETVKRGYLARKIHAEAYDNVKTVMSKGAQQAGKVTNMHFHGDLNVKAPDPEKFGKAMEKAENSAINPYFQLHRKIKS